MNAPASTTTTASLLPADIDKFARFRISLELLIEEGVERVTDRQAREKYGITGSGSSDMSGIAYPIFSPVTGYRTTGIVRRDHPEIGTDGKPKKKYMNPYGGSRHLYIPRGCWEWFPQHDISVAFVEAPTSALGILACSRRTGIKVIPIAMLGCWSWTGRIGKTEDANGHRVDVTGPLPDLHYSKGHPVIVALDSNALTNAKVKQARKSLVAVLRKLGCGVITTPNLPLKDGINGPDDYLATCTDQEFMDYLFGASAADDDGDRAKLHLLRGPEIKNEPVPWLLHNRIPDKTTVGIHGMPGDGKTRIALRIGADLSRGKTPFTGEPCPPRNVLVMTNEDSPSRIKELYTGMGGDLERLTVEDTDDCWWLGDRERLEIAISEARAGYVVVDSLASHCGTVDLNKQAETAALLIPLRPLAERHGCLIVAVHHYNKTDNPNHIRRVGGSIGITQSFRHHMHVVPEPDNPTRKLLLNGKTNLAPPNVPALAFVLDDDSCNWDGTSEVTLDEALSTLPNTKAEQKEKKANRWLHGALADGEWHMAADLLEQAKTKSGIPERSLFRAANDLQIERERRGFGQKMYWRLTIPANSGAASGDSPVGNGKNDDAEDLDPENSIPANTAKGRGSVGSVAPPNGHDRHVSEIERLVQEIVRLVESDDDASLDDDYFFAHIRGQREDILKAIQSAIDQGLIANEGGSHG
jgi:hypothetical protein